MAAVSGGRNEVAGAGEETVGTSWMPRHSPTTSASAATGHGMASSCATASRVFDAAAEAWSCKGTASAAAVRVASEVRGHNRSNSCADSKQHEPAVSSLTLLLQRCAVSVACAMADLEWLGLKLGWRTEMFARWLVGEESPAAVVVHPLMWTRDHPLQLLWRQQVVDAMLGAALRNQLNRIAAVGALVGRHATSRWRCVGTASARCEVFAVWFRDFSRARSM